MKKFSKLALALLVAVSMVILSAGCDTQRQKERVLYKSSGGDAISGTRITEVTGSAGYVNDYLDVNITIRDPNNSSKTIASGSQSVGISGTSLESVYLTGGSELDDTDYYIRLQDGIIYGNTIEYTVSGTYGSSKYDSKTIIFTKQ